MKSTCRVLVGDMVQRCFSFLNAYRVHQKNGSHWFGLATLCILLLAVLSALAHLLVLGHGFVTTNPTISGRSQRKLQNYQSHLEMREWGSTLLNDLQQQGFGMSRSSDIRVGMRYLTAEAFPFWMVVPYNMSLPAGDINEKVWDTGHFYYSLESDIAKKILNTQCTSNFNLPQLMVDVGANTGYFALLASSSGCHAIAVEPYKLHTEFLELSKTINGFSTRMKIVPKIVSNEAAVSFDGWSASPVNGKGTAKVNEMTATGIQDQAAIHQANSLIRLDDLVQEDVLYLKIDVEGHEPSVFASASDLFVHHVVKYVLFEMTYYLHGWKDLEYLKVLELLLDQKFKLFHLEAVRPLEEPGRTLPSTKDGANEWLQMIKSKECDPSVRHFCQLNIFAVHPQAQWPL